MTQTPAGNRILSPGPSLASVTGSAWPALLLATVCLVPFLNKAFLIDDPHFLTMAGQIVKHPLHPMDFDLCWNTVENCTKAYILTPGNALMGYALVPTVLAGAPEWMAHLTQLVFAWIAIVAMSSLILRLGWSRGYAMMGALLLVAIPPFLPMASTAMPDVLATAVGLVGIERLAAWKAERRWSQGVAAAVALGLAGFARGHLALMVPLAAFFLLDSLDPREIFAELRHRLWLWTPVVGAGIVLLAVLAATRERNLALDPPASFSGRQNILINFRSYLLYFAFPLPLAACWVANRWKNRSPWLAITLLAGAVVGTLRAKATFLAVVGLGTLVDLLFEAWRKREHDALFLSLWLLVPLPIVYYGHLPIKYLLPCVPAIILICFRLSLSFPARAAKFAGIFLIVAGISYSLLILRSDAEFANFGRVALDRLIRARVSAGEKVWFGNQFSSYWYARKAGGTLLVPGSHIPSSGDLIAVGMFEGGAATLRRFPHRTLVESLSHTYRFGRTMGGGIGLYSNRVGTWLWGVGESDWDRYELWRIDPDTVPTVRSLHTH